MKKHLSALFLTTLMLPLSSLADDTYRAQKLALVKSIYQSYSLGRGEITDKKFTKDFYSVWESDSANQAAGGAPCIGADPVIDGQDFDDAILKKTLKVKYLPNGKVEATFRQFNFDKKFTAVRFAIECSGNKCLVDEIFYKDDPDNPNQWFAFKKGLRKCIADDIAERKQERQKKLNAMQSKKPTTQYNRKTDSGCSCASGISCIGPRGGRYCITSGGNKRYY